MTLTPSRVSGGLRALPPQLPLREYTCARAYMAVCVHTQMGVHTRAHTSRVHTHHTRAQAHPPHSHACMFTCACTHAWVLQFHQKCLALIPQFVGKAWFSGPLGGLEGPRVGALAPSASDVSDDAAPRTAPEPPAAEVPGSPRGGVSTMPQGSCPRRAGLASLLLCRKVLSTRPQEGIY